MAKTESYMKLRAKLDEVVAQLQDFDGDIDKAFKLYEQGQATVAKLEKYLKDAKNTLEKLK